MLKLAKLLDQVARNVGRLAGWLIVPLVFIILFDVVTRKLDFTRLMFSEWGVHSGFSVSTMLQDFQWHLHAVLLLLSFGLGYLTNAHVRVDIFREMLPRRKQAWLELIGLIVLGIPFLILMIKFSWDQFYISLLQNEGSESMTGIPKRFIVKSFMVIGFLLVFAAVLATIMRLIVFLKGSQSESDEAIGDLSIFSDQSTSLAEAQRAAEELLMKEKAADALKNQSTT
ncbi:MAG: TRAP transporter small permease subunit [Granulosicoccus sp.]|nr:TRAP transporter small permease subunit [Granulosicoccus sp.]